MLQAYVRRICEFLLVSYFPFFIWAAQVMKILEIFHHMMMEHLFFSCFNVVTTQYTLVSNEVCCIIAVKQCSFF